MRASKAIKNILYIDLMIGIAITIFVWNKLGNEGMAEKFCDYVRVERCEELGYGNKETKGGTNYNHQEAAQARKEAGKRTADCQRFKRAARRRSCETRQNAR